VIGTFSEFVPDMAILRTADEYYGAMLPENTLAHYEKIAVEILETGPGWMLSPFTVVLHVGFWQSHEPHAATHTVTVLKRFLTPYNDLPVWWSVIPHDSRCRECDALCVALNRMIYPVATAWVEALGRLQHELFETD